MSNKQRPMRPEPRPPQEAEQATEAAPQPGMPIMQAPRLLQITGADAAPFLYADTVLAYGTLNGIVQLEGAAQVLVPTAGEGAKPNQRVVHTFHLRLTPTATVQLIDAAQKALAFLTPKSGNGQAN